MVESVTISPELEKYEVMNLRINFHIDMVSKLDSIMKDVQLENIGEIIRRMKSLEQEVCNFYNNYLERIPEVNFLDYLRKADSLLCKYWEFVWEKLNEMTPKREPEESKGKKYHHVWRTEQELDIAMAEITHINVPHFATGEMISPALFTSFAEDYITNRQILITLLELIGHNFRRTGGVKDKNRENDHKDFFGITTADPEAEKKVIIIAIELIYHNLYNTFPGSKPETIPPDLSELLDSIYSNDEIEQLNQDYPGLREILHKLITVSSLVESITSTTIKDQYKEMFTYINNASFLIWPTPNRDVFSASTEIDKILEKSGANSKALNLIPSLTYLITKGEAGIEVAPVFDVAEEAPSLPEIPKDLLQKKRIERIYELYNLRDPLLLYDSLIYPLFLEEHPFENGFSEDFEKIVQEIFSNLDVKNPKERGQKIRLMERYYDFLSQEGISTDRFLSGMTWMFENFFVGNREDDIDPDVIDISWCRQEDVITILSIFGNPDYDKEGSFEEQGIYESFQKIIQLYFYVLNDIREIENGQADNQPLVMGMSNRSSLSGFAGHLDTIIKEVFKNSPEQQYHFDGNILWKYIESHPELFRIYEQYERISIRLPNGEVLQGSSITGWTPKPLWRITQIIEQRREEYPRRSRIGPLPKDALGSVGANVEWHRLSFPYGFKKSDVSDDFVGKLQEKMREDGLLDRAELPIPIPCVNINFYGELKLFPMFLLPALVEHTERWCMKAKQYLSSLNKKSSLKLSKEDKGIVNTALKVLQKYINQEIPDSLEGFRELCLSPFHLNPIHLDPSHFDNESGHFEICNLIRVFDNMTNHSQNQDPLLINFVETDIIEGDLSYLPRSVMPKIVEAMEKQCRLIRECIAMMFKAFNEERKKSS